MEIGLRAALLQEGRGALGRLLQDWADLADAAYTPPVGQHLVERRKLGLVTIFGPVELRRNYYYDGQAGFCPADAALGLEGHCTPTLAKWLCRAGADGSYVKAGADLSEFTGVPVDARQVERVVQRLGPAVEPWREPLPPERPALPLATFYLSYDMTGVPMRPEELRGRQGKQPDGSAKSREVKLGCVFTQTAVDAQGHPIRDPDSTTYLSSFRPMDEFGGMMRKEALRRGMASAPRMAVLSDGARCNWEVARVNFPCALQILDFYHGMEHVGNLVNTLEAKDSPAAHLLRDEARAASAGAIGALAALFHSDVRALPSRLTGMLEDLQASVITAWEGAQAARLRELGDRRDAGARAWAKVRATEDAQRWLDAFVARHQLAETIRRALAAIDHQRLAGHERRLGVVSQEIYRLGDFFRAAYPAVARLARQVIQPLADIASAEMAAVQTGAQHRGVHRTRQSSIAADVITIT